MFVATFLFGLFDLFIICSVFIYLFRVFFLRQNLCIFFLVLAVLELVL